MVRLSDKAGEHVWQVVKAKSSSSSHLPASHSYLKQSSSVPVHDPWQISGCPHGSSETVAKTACFSTFKWEACWLRSPNKI